MPDAREIQPQLLELLAAIEVGEQAALAVRSWGAPAFEVLRGIVRGDIEADGYQRANAVLLLGKVEEPKAVDEIARALGKDKLAAVRFCAIDALRGCGGPTARKALLVVAVDGKADISERLHAVEALGAIGEPDDIASLEKIELADTDVALADRIKEAAAAIRYRAGAPDRDQEKPAEPSDDAKRS